jgi:hypothetical protein
VAALQMMDEPTDASSPVPACACLQRQVVNDEDEDDDAVMKAIKILGRDTPSPHQRKFMKATSLIGARLVAGSTRSAEHEQEDDAAEQAFEAQGVQELGRAYAGLIITRAALRRARGVEIEPKQLGLRRRRKSVKDYLHTHA